MLDALLDAYSASDAEKEALLEYAGEAATLDDIDLQELSADDRRVLFQHAVLLSFADGDQSPEEVAIPRGARAEAPHPRRAEGSEVGAEREEVPAPAAARAAGAPTEDFGAGAHRLALDSGIARAP